MLKIQATVLSLIMVLASAVLADDNKAEKTLTIYTSRQPQLLRPLADKFTKETGIKTVLFNGKDNFLIEKLKIEGKKSPADLLMTVDVGNLAAAEQAGLFTPVKSKVLNKTVPSEWRSKKNNWFGLSLRARTVVYNTDKVKPGTVTYQDLATEKYKGALCLRTSRKVYNQSLIGSFIAHDGKKKTQKLLEGWVSNLAYPVFSSDRKVLQAVASGECKYGIVNSYYLGRMQKDGNGKNIGVVWPNQKDRGVHVNLSGAGVVKTSKNKKAAKQFLEWLVKKDQQQFFADSNFEYPIDSSIALNSIIKSWGTFKRDTLDLNKVARLQKDSTNLAKKSGYK